MSNINPAHYIDEGISALEFLEANDNDDLEFARGNVIKYTMRAERKNGAEDYCKAIWYLRYLAARKNGETAKKSIELARELTADL